MSAVCGLRFTDLRQVAFSCMQRISIDVPDKAIKQSRDLKYVLFLLIYISSMYVYCAASCTGLQNQRSSTEVAGWSSRHEEMHGEINAGSCL